MPALMKPSWITSVHHDVYAEIDATKALKDSAKGKTVLITGAGRGIGRAIAQAFSLAGASRIILTSRTSTQLDEVEKQIREVSESVTILKVTSDVTKPESVASLFEQIDGSIDVLVNNAGVLEQNIILDQQDPDAWMRTWDVNIKGTFLPIRQFLLRSKSGVIINTSSIGSITTSPGFSAYQPSKTAINRITHFLDVEYPDLKTFAYHPGAVWTDMAKDSMPKDTWEWFVDTPELAGNYCVWLASGQADFLKGRYSDCTWDVGQMIAHREKIVTKDLLKEMIEME